MMALLEAGVLTRSMGLLPALVRRVSQYKGLVWDGFQHYALPARLLGEASALLSKSKDARRFYEEGLEVSQKVRFRPEIALIRLDLAELLLEHYADERDAAIEHLDFAIGEFREMKMQPSLERALRHRGLLKA
jgi:hypothetical protein